VLVVRDHVHLAVELGVEVVLAAGELVSLILHRSSVGRATLSETVVCLVVDSKVRVESSFAVSWAVWGPKTTRVVRNVSVTAASIVDVDDGLGVNSGQVVRWTLFLDCERTYKKR